ncbi:tetratricopeptide repeat protein [Hymenobacter weizhouensis]|uniref:tetratricopeptide repeat protein n=1 Tax=Hymenobacter sp. YIM 151500-1 TaxID=2987689 RepID=UPI002226A55B|nr:tetratricopeptide repeat protein [Hymenobacter sp. YIM 151500-1]UYZ62746.1 tetratricopeptide repeat protein [Hymenobacter sp. YIM 151500-1]
MRFVVCCILILLGSWPATALAQQPARPAGKSAEKPAKPAKPRKLTRKERRDLARRAAVEAVQRQQRYLSEKEREQSEAYFVDGVRLLLLEEYNRAQERFLKAYALNPTNAAVNYKIAETNLLSGNLEDATNFAQAAVRLDPDNAYYYLLLAQVYASRKQYDQAAEVYTTLIRDVPDSGYYLFNLADLYLAQGKLNEALATFERAEKQFGTLEEVSFKKQQIYLKQNNLDQALKEGEALIKANPDQVRYVLAQAQMYAANNRFPDAIRVAEQALKQDPDNPRARMILADVYRQQNNPAESQKQVKLAFESTLLDIDDKVRILVDYIKQLPNPALNQTALELAAITTRVHPKEAKAFSIAGDIQTVVEKRADARTNYLKALRLDNSRYQIWQQVVLIDAELSQTDSLLRHTEQALELFPNQAPLWFYNGVGHLLKKQPAKGIKSLEYGRKLATDNPELLAQFDTQLGDAYHEVKDYAKSDAAYEAALAFDANNAQALNNYSYYLALRGLQLDKAKEMAGKLVKQFPDNDTYLDTYAWVLYKLKDYAGARQHLEKALRSTSDATVIEHYGDVLYQLGEKEQALAQWQRAQKRGGASPLIDRKIKDKKLYE